MTSYAVSRRRTEIGLRMALGAAPGRPGSIHAHCCVDPLTRVVSMVLARVRLLVGRGILAGGAITLWASRFAETLLYGLTPRDPVTVTGAIVVLAAIGMVAGWLPAMRAARVDPTLVLRES